MTGWAGTNWQFFDDEDTQTRIGVTFGLGLLDEEVAATGTLSLVLSALRTELSRPVELGPGRTGFPEVIVELGTDTATLLVRGASQTAAAAWRRLPNLFAGWIVTEQTSPIRPEHPVWPADLVRRTGRNAAALASVQVSAADARNRARALLPRLDPGAGKIRSTFFTTDESLIGVGFRVIESAPGPVPSSCWADGTEKLLNGPGLGGTGPDSPEKPAIGNGRGTLPAGEESVLISTLVPRSAAGLAAAELLRTQLAACAANAGQDPEAIGIGMVGIGAQFCVFLLSETAPGTARRRVLLEFGRSMSMVPDSWVDDAVQETAEGISPRLARERRSLGLDDDQGADAAQVRQALIEATHCLHLALEPIENPSAVTKSSTKGAERIFRPLAGGTPPMDRSTTLALAEDSVALRTRSGGHGGGTKNETRIKRDKALAVLVDPAGTLAIIDDDQQVLSFHPLLFRRSRLLRQRLDTQLHGLPHLENNNDADPAGVSRRRRRATRRPLWLLAGATVVIGYLVVSSVLSNSDEPQVTERITIGQTAQLGNGTTITATGFEKQPKAPEDLESQVAVHVRFCAGGDTSSGDFRPETQRSVSPTDFGMFNEQSAAARLIDSDEQLRRDTLAQGQCAVRDLVFKGVGLAVPRLSYTNSLGDDVIWYSTGQVPSAP
ncbi:hypothetical protein ACIGB6_07290 [Paeniglutamicibacter gangotriensis]|uniref:hypothetical protein n=1 Tax=Paeniglutamicibacter gangotriensis TaxID=254787 RepID=UPI0037C99841